MHTVARSHGTRAPTPRASRMSRVRVARSRVRPVVRLYMAHMGVDPPGVTAAGRRCGLDGGLVLFGVIGTRILEH